MVNGTMRDIGQQVQTDAESIKASSIADEKQDRARHAVHDGSGRVR